MIAMMDPNFATDGRWNAELGDGTAAFPGYRGVLKSRLSEMVNGVRCDFKDHGTYNAQAGMIYGSTDIACADVNTGISATTVFTRPDGWYCRDLVPLGGSCTGFGWRGWIPAPAPAPAPAR
jgi:hypothetical protein